MGKWGLAIVETEGEYRRARTWYIDDETEAWLAKHLGPPAVSFIAPKSVAEELADKSVVEDTDG